MFNRNDYVSDKDWQRFLDFSKDLETPNIVINLNTIKQNYIRLYSKCSLIWGQTLISLPAMSWI